MSGHEEWQGIVRDNTPPLLDEFPWLKEEGCLNDSSLIPLTGTRVLVVKTFSVTRNRFLFHSPKDTSEDKS